MLAIIVAMQRELAGIDKVLSLRRAGRLHSPYLLEGEGGGQGVVLAATGIGTKKKDEIVSFVVENYRPDALICLGYAGAASKELGVGNLVLYSQVQLLEEFVSTKGDIHAMNTIPSDPQLESLADKVLRKTELPFHKGGGVTVPNLIGDPETKRWIGTTLGVKALDMESYWVAEVARRQGLPFLGVRAITDSMTQRVPDLAGVVNGRGDPSVFLSMAYALRHPLDIYPMLRLARSSRLATRNLVEFLSNFLHSQ